MEGTEVCNFPTTYVYVCPVVTRLRRKMEISTILELRFEHCHECTQLPLNGNWRLYRRLRYRTGTQSLQPNRVSLSVRQHTAAARQCGFKSIQSRTVLEMLTSGSN